MKIILIAAATLLASAGALADECDNASTQTAMNMCTAEQAQTADKKLNQTWQDALKRAAPAQRELMKKAQQAWITLRDADCEFIASGVEGGSVQPMIHNQCIADKTIEREAWLSSLLQCEEGDMSCPLPPAG
ncbi:DUF1311 domain-containing protein [Yokenella regensburgei]|uniref:lysozyme inhibitor LprI family protein n=1 Tax=Yokenella regensburgei TaxID=158877 RepID=UPI003F17F010